nr:MAG TPA: hypothetical protein [Caudoviricetes sp.]
MYDKQINELQKVYNNSGGKVGGLKLQTLKAQREELAKARRAIMKD